ncbi:uncharacterized protein LOC131634699 [Vicia villosa]|uniref:uncharacterized protein LOC131634699 n=1 Tax=Vicia villosa TaxID=3911 RepID=UPI00273CE52C|nr:uncharacterized protein LOC131634699 [Vicia villosa]
MTSASPVASPTPFSLHASGRGEGNKPPDNGGGGSSIRRSSESQKVGIEGVSYRNVVTGEIGEDGGVSDGGGSKEMGQEEHEDLFVDTEGITMKEGKRGGYDCPLIILSKYDETRIQRPWRRGVIVKLLGRRIGFKALENRLKQMWVRKGIIRIIDLGYDYYLVCFTHDDDKNAAMMDGPWFIYDHYLTVKEWTPDFHPENDSIVNVAVWIRISGLPVEYYDPIILQIIGNLVGRTIKVDKNTLQGERGKYARICVEVDISKPLLAMFELKNKSYRVEFEGLHLRCITCGEFGHYKEGCPQKMNLVNNAVTSNDQGGMVDGEKTGKTNVAEGLGAGDGPWQVVQKQRRPKKSLEVRKKSTPAGSWLAKVGSRFHALGGDGGETSFTNKETINEDTMDMENGDMNKEGAQVLMWKILWSSKLKQQ